MFARVMFAWVYCPHPPPIDFVVSFLLLELRQLFLIFVQCILTACVLRQLNFFALGLSIVRSVGQDSMTGHKELHDGQRLYEDDPRLDQVGAMVPSMQPEFKPK